MKYNIKVGERWLIGESATETIKGTVRGDTTAVFSRMVGEMSAYDFADNRAESSSFDRITLCDYLRGIVDRQNYGHYLGEIKVIPEDQEEAEAQLPKRGEWIVDGMYTYNLRELNGKAYEPVYRCSCCNRQMESYLRLDEPKMPEDADFPEYCPHCGARMEVQE